MAEVWSAVKEDLKRRVTTDVKETVVDVVKAPIGGVIDATREALDKAFLGPFVADTKPRPTVAGSIGGLITQPILRLGRAGLNLLKLRPFKAAAEIGIAGLVDVPIQALNLVESTINYVVNAVRSVIPGLGRAVIGVTTEDIKRDRFKTTPAAKAVSIPMKFGADSPGFGGGAAAAAA